MGTLPALIAFQPPQMNVADTYTAMARLAAYDQARRTSALEQEEKRGRLDREALWRQTIAGALQPPTQGFGQGFTAPQTQAAAPPPGGGVPQPPASTLPQEPTMPPVGVNVPVNTQTGQWGQPGGFTATQPGMPPDITAMAQPADPTQPLLQGGGFTAAPSPQAAQGGFTAQTPSVIPQQGFTAPQPTRPLSASVPGLMPMPNAEAVQRAFAIDPEKTSQWYGAYLTQRGKQLDEVKRNNQLVYQVSSAILEHPDYYQEGLDYLREQGVPVPKNMPPTMNAAQISFYRDRSRDIDIGVKEAQMQNQQAQARLHREQAADVPVRTQLESTRLGLQGQPAAVTTELRAMGVNPAAATPAQIQQAQKNIQQRELELKGQEGYAGKMADLQAQQQFRQTQTVGEVFKQDLPTYYDTRTGRAIPTQMKYQDYAALPQGAVKQLSDDERKQQENVNSAMPRLQILQQHIDALYGSGGVLARMTPEDREILTTLNPRSSSSVVQQFMQKYPELAAAQKYIEANAESLARALSGVKGAATEEDVERARAMLPSLTTALKVWPLSQLGMSLPDTRATALRTMNNLVDTLNGISGSILGNPEFKHPLHRYETAEEAQRRSGGPVTPPTSTPPATPPPVSNEPAGPTFGAPPQRRYVPGEGTPPTPAPSPARPTPGRQSQVPTAVGPTRVAGFFDGPKVMSPADVAEAMAQTGRSRDEVEAAARARGYRVVPETQVAGWWDPRRSNGTVA